jgi:hypothetical protein
MQAGGLPELHTGQVQYTPTPRFRSIPVRASENHGFCSRVIPAFQSARTLDQARSIPPDPPGRLRLAHTTFSTTLTTRPLAPDLQSPRGAEVAPYSLRATNTGTKLHKQFTARGPDAPPRMEAAASTPVQAVGHATRTQHWPQHGQEIWLAYGHSAPERWLNCCLSPAFSRSSASPSG